MDKILVFSVLRNLEMFFGSQNIGSKRVIRKILNNKELMQILNVERLCGLSGNSCIF